MTSHRVLYSSDTGSLLYESKIATHIITHTLFILAEIHIS